jgi:hypothetical protein
MPAPGMQHQLDHTAATFDPPVTRARASAGNRRAGNTSPGPTAPVPAGVCLWYVAVLKGTDLH